jgi:hypothetical protein
VGSDCDGFRTTGGIQLVLEIMEAVYSIL